MITVLAMSVSSANGTRRPFVVVAWITADWWGSQPYDEIVWAQSRADAMQQMEERLVADGARVRSITCHEEVTA